jgi:hypothetical protein
VQFNMSYAQTVQNTSLHTSVIFFLMLEYNWSTCITHVDEPMANNFKPNFIILHMLLMPIGSTFLPVLL